MNKYWKTGIVALWALLPGAVTTTEANILHCRVEVDHPVLPANSRGHAVVKVTLDAPDVSPDQVRVPVNLSIVLDRSGSMRGDKIEYARQAAIEAIRRLHPQDIVSLVTYDSAIETIIPAQHPRDLEWMEDQIRRITPRGMTALFGGVSQGAAELRKHQDGRFVHRMILLSDGVANVGPSQPADLARLGASLQKENIQVSTVGVGMDYNEDLMTGLARESGGNTYFVEHSADLPRILTAELGEAHQMVARRVTVQIDLPTGVHPVRIIGRDGRITRNQVEVPLHHLNGGQRRYALVEVVVDPHTPDASIELAQARVSYDHVLTSQRVTVPPQSVSVRFSPDVQEVEQAVNVEVEREVLFNRLAEARDEAIRHADEGRRAEAASSLRSIALDLDRVGGARGDDRLRQQAAQVGSDAEALEVDGLSNPQRKRFRASSYQIITQQDVQ